ncbi:MAG: stage V sporulation protein AD [Sporomusaceae bacterium]|jgi:stage V sporulation protein AD|nr:stage V sporulation protein AD [Sporomusaceae bacterium]
MNKKLGSQSLVFLKPPVITGAANIGGKMESEGPLGKYLDNVLKDSLCNHDTWEQCESHMLEKVVHDAAQKAEKTLNKIDLVFAGDLLNQLMSSHFAARALERPFLGLYGACATLAQAMLTGACFIDGGFAANVAVATSSHHDASERQYRFPTELGVQRPLIAQWTVTGAGALILSNTGPGPKITGATIGKVIDMGLKDPNAMGPAMAPAAAATLWQHLTDTGRPPTYYDMIYTGDLGKYGKQLVLDLMQEKGLDLSQNYQDCGCMLYNEGQDVHAGASGCASSAIVFTGYIYHRLQQATLKKILLIGTGSLHSTTSYQQKESIPCIAHAVSVEVD